MTSRLSNFCLLPAEGKLDIRMRYSHIIELIDIYLDQLFEARRLLAACASPAVSERAAKTQSPARARLLRRDQSPPTTPKRAIAFSQPLPASAPSGGLTKSLVNRKETRGSQSFSDTGVPEDRSSDDQSGNPKDLGAKETFPTRPTMRPARKKNSRAKIKSVSSRRSSVQMALSANIPSSPVFVPADRVRAKSSNPDDASATNGASASESSLPFTADLLTQRWISNPPA